MLSGKSWASSATKQRLNSEDLMQIDSKGQITLLHITDLHGQLNPIFYRAPSQNYGVGNYENIPPHLIGEAFLSHFGINESTPLAYAHTMLNYVELAKEYGRLLRNLCNMKREYITDKNPVPLLIPTPVEMMPKIAVPDPINMILSM